MKRRVAQTNHKTFALYEKDETSVAFDGVQLTLGMEGFFFVF